MINTAWLRSFCTLADIGHFTRTAHELHMTQSGVSQHVRKLEQQLGVELLVRQGKQFTLSDAGQRLYKDARKVLLELSNLEIRIADDPAYEGVVRIMSPGSVGLRLYPKLLALQKTHSQLVIEYRFAPNGEVEKAVAEGHADIGIMSTTSARVELSCEPIASESLLLVTPAAVETPNWQNLNELGFIDHPDGSHHANLLLGANYPQFQHSHMLKNRGFSNQIGLILEPVSLGLGFSVLPAHAVTAFARPALIRAHRLANPVSETLHLCLQRQRTLPRRMHTVIEEARRWL